MSLTLPRVAMACRQALILTWRSEESKVSTGCERVCKLSFSWAQLLHRVSRRFFLLAVIPSPLLVVKAQEMSAHGGGSKKTFQPLLQEADKLLQIYEWNKVYDLLYPFKDVEDVELLWRLTKSAYEISIITKEKKLVRRLENDGYQWIQRAMKMDDKHPEVHKMMAVMLDAYHKHLGVKSRLSVSTEVKQHMIIASNLNPNDPHPFYMLGWWYYSVADLPWAHVQIARIIFSSQVEATFEEALQYFEQSLDRDKDHSRFYMMNLVMLGKSHLKLGHTEEALKYLKQVSEHQPRTNVDREACVEAASLITQLTSSTEPKRSQEVTK